MKTNDDSFFAEPIDARQEARFLALEVVCRLLIWVAEGASLEERGVRATVALYCIRPDLIGEATRSDLQEIRGVTASRLSLISSDGAGPSSRLKASRFPNDRKCRRPSLGQNYCK